MASLAQHTEPGTWIDKSLDYLAKNWAAIPEIAAAWDAWDENDRLDFVLEWPLREDRLHQLHRWRGEGMFSPIQLQRLQELQKLIDQNRPTLQRLLEDGSGQNPVG